MSNLQIFIAGPRAICNLTKEAENRLYGIYKKDYSILVGDASGVDTAIQKYFFHLGYKNVTVYASNGKARNNIGNWPVRAVPVSDSIRGFDFYAMKDKAMASAADYGFMIWNGESKGTLCNIINLLKGNKKTLVYFNPKNSFIWIDSFDELEKLVSHCGSRTNTLYNRLRVS